MFKSYIVFLYYNITDSNPQDLDVIFSNILDIYDCTAKLLRSVEDQVEMAQEGEMPVVGTCFADLTEASII